MCVQEEITQGVVSLSAETGKMTADQLQPAFKEFTAMTLNREKRPTIRERLAPGADASEKLLHIGQVFSAAFASLAPSFHLLDLCVGAAGAVLIRLAVYSKGKNAKKEIPPGDRVRERPLGHPGRHRPLHG